MCVLDGVPVEAKEKVLAANMHGADAEALRLIRRKWVLASGSPHALPCATLCTLPETRDPCSLVCVCASLLTQPARRPGIHPARLALALAPLRRFFPSGELDDGGGAIPPPSAGLVASTAEEECADRAGVEQVRCLGVGRWGALAT